MNAKLKICLFFCIFFTEISVAQTPIDSLILNSEKIDFENLKQLSNRFFHKSFDCDSLNSGTSVELRYCLNMRLQREDSLLRAALNDINSTFDDTLFIKKIKLTQEIWERYRYAYCQQCIGNYGNDKMDVFHFLECAIELTFKRREDIEKMCGD